MPAAKKRAKRKPAAKKKTARHARSTGQTARIRAKMKAVLTSLKKGASITAATEAAGLGRTTFYDLLETDPAFKAAAAVAPHYAIRLVEHAMFKRARSMTYKGAQQAGQFLLQNRLPDEYQNVQDHRIVEGADRVDILKRLVEGGERGTKKPGRSGKADR